VVETGLLGLCDTPTVQCLHVHQCGPCYMLQGPAEGLSLGLGNRGKGIRFPARRTSSLSYIGSMPPSGTHKALSYWYVELFSRPVKPMGKGGALPPNPIRLHIAVRGRCQVRPLLLTKAQLRRRMRRTLLERPHLPVLQCHSAALASAPVPLGRSRHAIVIGPLIPQLDRACTNRPHQCPWGLYNPRYQRPGRPCRWRKPRD
jgi:hypothetical protein